MLNALIYAELVLTFPENGSDYVYIREGFGPWAAFLYNWVMMVFERNAARAIVALTFSKYFCAMFFPTCSAPEELKILIAAIALTTVVVIQCYSTKFTIMTSNFFTAAKLTGLIMIIIIGIGFLFIEGSHNLNGFFTGTSTNVGDYVLGFYAAYWAYSGTGACVSIIEELKLPLKQNILFAIITALCTVTIVYMLTNLAYVSVLSVPDILTSPAVAFTFGLTVLPGFLFWVMPFFVACSTFGNMSNGVMLVARIAMAGARQRHLPRPFSLLQEKTLTPVPGLLFGLVMSLLMMVSSKIYTLIHYTSYISVLVSAMSVVTNVRFRFQYPEMEREFKLPIVIPVAYLLISAFFLIYPFYSNPIGTIICFAVIATGLPIYFLVIVPEQTPACLDRFETVVTHFIQKLFMCLPEEFEAREYKTADKGRSNPAFEKGE